MEALVSLHQLRYLGRLLRQRVHGHSHGSEPDYRFGCIFQSMAVTSQLHMRVELLSMATHSRQEHETNCGGASHCKHLQNNIPAETLASFVMLLLL